MTAQTDPGAAAPPRSHDVIVIGGGPVGSAFAIALREAGVRVLLVEARTGPSTDRRSIALSYGSRLVLERLGVWPRLQDATPIDSIHVSQRAGFGRALLHAGEAGLPALGYVVPYATLHAALTAGLAHCDAVEVRPGSEVIDLRPDADGVTVVCRSEGREWQARAALAVLADGGSLARAAAAHRERAYSQSAVVAEVRTGRTHGNRAYERFTPAGPMALLPSGDRFALVWTTTPERATELLDLDDAAFLHALQAAFGGRAGHFIDCSARAAYPLALRVSGPPRQPHVALLGNAAQTLHPVAGQGLNLGLRDAWQLAQLAARERGSIGTTAFLERYRRARQPDRASTIALTDLLVGTFSNDLGPLRWARGFGLTLLDLLAPAKRAFISRMTFGG